jgi:hypothetical protein
MPFYAIHLLSPVEHLYWVLRHGTYLAQRWHDKNSVNFYHCEGNSRGFFVEVGIDDDRGQAVVLRSFVHSNLGTVAIGIQEGPLTVMRGPSCIPIANCISPIYQLFP